MEENWLGTKMAVGRTRVPKDRTQGPDGVCASPTWPGGFPKPQRDVGCLEGKRRAQIAFKNPARRLGMVSYTCHPRLRQEDDRFQVSLGYRVMSCLKKSRAKKIHKESGSNAHQML